MRYLVDELEMRQIEEDAMEGAGIPSMVLMERAALSVVEEIRQRADAPSVLCVCGMGNNGADGLAVARILAESDIPVEVFCLGREENATAEWKKQREILDAVGVFVVKNPSLSEYTVVVDAIFGIGLKRNVEGSFAEWIGRINESRAWVISVDMPSGISASSGEELSVAVRADVTVTFGAIKAGLIFYPGAVCAGEVVVKQIGFPARSFLSVKPKLYTLGREAERMLPKRMPDYNKGSAGKLLVIAGSKNMAGAAYLAASAAYRMGAGLVRIFTTESNRISLQQLLPEAVLVTYEEEISNLLKESLDWADAVVAGPGIGMADRAVHLMEELSKYALSHRDKPYILDADALNILSCHTKLWEGFSGCSVITPHMGEIARIAKTDIAGVKKDRIACARRVAADYQTVCVCKDARTIVCEAEGPCYVNTSGNSGMAKAGSGDVLSGMIACLSIKLPLRQAAELGVYLHGLAGDMAKKKLGEYAMMASDLVEQAGYLTKILQDGGNNEDRC